MILKQKNLDKRKPPVSRVLNISKHYFVVPGLKKPTGETMNKVRTLL